MRESQSLLEKLEQLLAWKKSKKFMADKLGISEKEIGRLLSDLRYKSSIDDEVESANYISELEACIVKYEEDISKGTGEVIFNSKEEIKTLDELIRKCKIDTEKWEITKYVQNYWGNESTPHWQVKAWMSKKTTEKEFQDSFVNFLKDYTPTHPKTNTFKRSDEDKPSACLVINKQDSHLNKLDINGENDIIDRFDNILHKVEIIVNQASLSNHIDDIYYIIGSDEFNSEFTGTTTKGTPQQNILSYHESFEEICNHEIDMITLLLNKTYNLNIIYVAGNHDEFIGWHLITWLTAYFKNNDRVSFDCSPKYRKYVTFGDTAMMFNHGDAIKPAKLAALFPMEYKDRWSEHSNFYIFTGDKHHELSHDFNGIKFYQIPAFSNAKSSWDDKNGYTTSRAEVTGFLIEEFNGMTNIFKQYL